ncbi:hypothetical protein [Micromonospora kangleipakensis]|uniref:hypothetical protein n=1 Tax=Micromonospora kangleipakensis TaxID=1077942 RepID=UPI001029E3B2|nr:hypothetical protein [Micromonospora kangleipakensis]
MREVVTRLLAAGVGEPGDPDIPIVAESVAISPAAGMTASAWRTTDRMNRRLPSGLSFRSDECSLRRR